MTGSPRHVNVTAVVPTNNSLRTLEACLMSLYGQHAALEIIVVDNASTDGTLPLARKWADRVLTAGAERSAQRNAGASAAQGDILIFLDSDMIADHGMVSEIASAFDHDHELTALVLPERSIGTGFWAECKILEKQLYLGDATVEAARAFRRATFDAVRGFDERIHGGGEDWDLPDRIRAQGGKIGRTKAGVTHDEGHVSLVHDLRKKMYYGRTFGRYAAKHPRRTLGLLVRPSAVGRLPRLFVRPSRAIGLVALKTLELFALCLGMAVAAIAGTHPADGDRVSSHIA